ncbi:MAG: hypothetical protein HYS22_00230 [Deltaproteobacteria bacterium]|nr:hypothetical protein [Deltaproteobacteria bacterium]
MRETLKRNSPFLVGTALLVFSGILVMTLYFQQERRRSVDDFFTHLTEFQRQNRLEIIYHEMTDDALMTLDSFLADWQRRTEALGMILERRLLVTRFFPDGCHASLFAVYSKGTAHEEYTLVRDKTAGWKIKSSQLSPMAPPPPEAAPSSIKEGLRTRP